MDLKKNIEIWQIYDNIFCLLLDANNVSLPLSINPSSVSLSSSIGLSTFFALTIPNTELDIFFITTPFVYITCGCLSQLGTQPGRSLPVHISWAAIGLHWPLMTENLEDFL